MLVFVTHTRPSGPVTVGRPPAPPAPLPFDALAVFFSSAIVSCPLAGGRADNGLGDADDGDLLTMDDITTHTIGEGRSERSQTTRLRAALPCSTATSNLTRTRSAVALSDPAFATRSNKPSHQIPTFPTVICHIVHCSLHHYLKCSVICFHHIPTFRPCSVTSFPRQ